MKKIWSDEDWEDYLYWQTQDKKTLKRINHLLQDVDRNGYNGIGKPEMLKGNLSGFCSRRINDVDRLVYRIADDIMEIASLSDKTHRLVWTNHYFGIIKNTPHL